MGAQGLVDDAWAESYQSVFPGIPMFWEHVGRETREADKGTVSACRSSPWSQKTTPPHIFPCATRVLDTRGALLTPPHTSSLQVP